MTPGQRLRQMALDYLETTVSDAVNGSIVERSEFAAYHDRLDGVGKSHAS